MRRSHHETHTQRIRRQGKSRAGSKTGKGSSALCINVETLSSKNDVPATRVVPPAGDSSATEAVDFILNLSVTAESGAKLLWRTRKDIYIRGQPFTLKFKFRNPTRQQFLGGSFTGNIEYPGGQTQFASLDVPSLQPEAAYESETLQFNALAEGYAHVTPYYLWGFPEKLVREFNRRIIVQYADDKGERLPSYIL